MNSIDEASGNPECGRIDEEPNQNVSHLVPRARKGKVMTKYSQSILSTATRPLEFLGLQVSEYGEVAEWEL
jgi:hypothetical protein